MRALSNNMAERIFDGYGPLSTFSAKIDVAFALDLIDADVHRDLRTIKDIRNCFAHTTHSYFSAAQRSRSFVGSCQITGRAATMQSSSARAPLSHHP